PRVRDYLNGQQTHERQAWNAKRKTQTCRIVDATLVERFEDACGRLRLVGRGRGDHLLRGWVGRRRGVETRAADAKTGIRFLPSAPPAVAALPHTGQVRLAVGC